VSPDFNAGVLRDAVSFLFLSLHPMLVLVAYDLSDDQTRRRVAKLLSGYGTRVQRSVFECRLSKREREDLEAQLAACLDDAPDAGPLGACSVRLYVICARCHPKQQLLGPNEPTTVPPACFVA